MQLHINAVSSGSARGTAAASFLAELTAAPQARVLAGIAGAGGSGKSTLLDDLETQYRTVGIPVRRGHSEIERYVDTGGCAFLVDDAHKLGESALTRIHSLVDKQDINLVVAYRPWPQPPAMRRLSTALEQHHPPVVLGPLTREEITSYAADALGGPVTTALVDQVLELTGGMPWMVQRVINAVRQKGRRVLLDPLPAHGLAETLGSELDAVDEEIRELLLALTIGFDLSGQLPRELEKAVESIDHLVAKAQAAGLLLPDGRPVPLVGYAVLAATPLYHIRTLQRSLVDTLTAEGRSLNDVARGLARGGLKDHRVARALEFSGDNALARYPALAATLYEEANAAGSDEFVTAARRAQAALARSDLDTAGRILDGLLTHDDAPDLIRGAEVAAAVWAQRGMLSNSAEVYRWLGSARIGGSAGLAAVAMIGTGDRGGAEVMLKVPAPGGSPTLLTVAATLMGRGIRGSLEGAPTYALPALIRASDMITASGITTVPLPEVPAVLAALVALHGGELDISDSIIDAALKGGQGGAAARPRLLLLQGWTAMQRGRPDQARAAINQATRGEAKFVPRDKLLLHALEVGLARRTGDGPTLMRAWKRACEDVLHVFVDLYDLMPLGELVVAAARLRDSRRLEPHLDEAWDLLTRLGDPPLWSVPLHWSAVQAGILAERPADLAPHAAALVRASEQNRLAAVLATAGRAWISVLAGHFEVSAVEAAARGLAAVGMTWDGSRLAGHAAPRAAERRDMARLLTCARELHPGAAAGSEAPPNQSYAGTRSVPGRLAGPGAMGVLSARECEVAKLVLDGKTYREIGEAIFISPRTAEHHIARMRRRLGAANRSELLIQLRLALDEVSEPAE